MVRAQSFHTRNSRAAIWEGLPYYGQLSPHEQEALLVKYRARGSSRFALKLHTWKAVTECDKRAASRAACNAATNHEVYELL